MSTPLPTTSPEQAESSTLERRRGRSLAANQAAEQARADAQRAEAQLEANTAQTAEHETALQHAMDEAARLRKALKALTKQRGKLRSARKEARRSASKAQRRARTAEAKYDRSVLAEMVRREKEGDRADAGQRPTDPEPSGDAAESANVAPQSRDDSTPHESSS